MLTGCPTRNDQHLNVHLRANKELRLARLFEYHSGAVIKYWGLEASMQYAGSDRDIEDIIDQMINIEDEIPYRDLKAMKEKAYTRCYY